MAGCDDLEQCKINAAPTSVCGGTDAVESTKFSITSNVVTASKIIIIGYEHVMCMTCFIHDTLSYSNVFTIKQHMGCKGYLEPIVNVVQ